MLFFEPKRLYNGPFDGHHDRPVEPWVGAPGERGADRPLSRSRSARPRSCARATALTILAYGTMVHVALAAARRDGRRCRGASTCARSLPLDIDTIVASVEKTGRCLIVHEATRTGGYGAELSALVQERCFYHLEAPIVRVTGWDTPYPHAFEWDYFPGPRARRRRHPSGDGACEERDMGNYVLQAARRRRRHRRGRDRRLARQGRRRRQGGPAARRRHDRQGDGRDRRAGLRQDRLAEGRSRARWWRSATSWSHLRPAPTRRQALAPAAAHGSAFRRAREPVQRMRPESGRRSAARPRAEADRGTSRPGTGGGARDRSCDRSRATDRTGACSTKTSTRCSSVA